MLEHDERDYDAFIANANLLVSQRDLGVTEELLEAFREVAARLEREHPWEIENLTWTHYHIAVCFRGLGYLNEALLSQQRATDMAQQYLDLDAREAQIHNLGNQYKALCNVQRAEELYREALALADESNNPLWKANHLACLAGCAQSQGRFDEALQHIAQAIELRIRIGDLGGYARNTREQSGVFLTIGEIDSALDAAARAYEQARDLKRPLREYCRAWAEARLAQGKAAEAYRLLMEPTDDQPGARWDFDNVLGTVLLCLRRPEAAQQRLPERWNRARFGYLAQTKIRGRVPTKRRLLPGWQCVDKPIHSCAQRRRIAPQYGPDTGVGTLKEWGRQLDQLAACAQTNLAEEILLEVFGAQVRS